MVLLCCNCSSWINKYATKSKEGANPIRYTDVRKLLCAQRCGLLQATASSSTTSKTLRAYFGHAAIMGGMPTDVNWNKQYVVALVLPETNKRDHHHPIDVKQSPGQCHAFSYQVNRGRKTSYTHGPLYRCSH